MARNFLAAPFAPYQGTYTSKAFNSDNGQKGLMVTLDILWATYQANGQTLGPANPIFAVSFNLNTAGPNTVAAQWYVQSVYVDNEGVDFPVFVYFLDTQFTISCPANAAGWYQVFTNGRQGLITGEGIDAAAISTGQRTRIFFTDVLMVPYLDQEYPNAIALWKSSPQNEFMLNAAYDTPALGDLVNSVELNIAAAGQVLSFTPSIYTYLILTSLYWSISSYSYSGGNANCTISLYNVTTNATPFSVNVGFTSTQKQNDTIMQMSGLNLKLNGTQQYNLASSSSGGGFLGIISTVTAYSYSNT